jgi:hypothetical protein
MTSFRQFEANRRNALKSTGPTTDAGKQRSRRNGVRHGLTAETVITTLEDEEDYNAFELSVTSCFDASTAVERELVLRLQVYYGGCAAPRRSTPVSSNFKARLWARLRTHRSHGQELTRAFTRDHSLVTVVNRALGLIGSGAMIEATGRSAT